LDFINDLIIFSISSFPSPYWISPGRSTNVRSTWFGPSTFTITGSLVNIASGPILFNNFF